jgi:rhodanese-related sulfurtransferase
MLAVPLGFDVLETIGVTVAARSSMSVVLFSIGLFSLVACQSVETRQEVGIKGGNYRVVSVQELQIMLENKDFTMINGHIPWQGDIAQTNLRLASNEIEKNLDQLPQDKDSKILVYCLTSGMAKEAISALLSQDYTDLWMLEGETTAWEAVGLSLIKE